eukprot:TRINITY_DN34007_c0_g1_i1.p1 TRINITY_DN34007_c0_g1~~TRINITY_DN34007_c0_g1_i1.p1  ORF type:complete len:260 (-),score=31.41 TRINITY_DN34007_c0_g1_i1:661-1374(-)
MGSVRAATMWTAMQPPGRLNDAGVLSKLVPRRIKGSEAEKNRFDKWAGTYDRDICSWGYTAPELVAAASEAFGVHKSGPILDLGCGTGLSGQRMKQKGYSNLHGCDISAASLEVLERGKPGVYKDTKVVDAELGPQPFEDGFFAGVICVGVLSSIKRVEGIFREWLRTSKPKAKFVFNHRDDLFAKEGDQCRQSMQKLCAEGLWKELHQSEPLEYLPYCPCEVQRNLRIRIFVFEKL